MKKSIRKLKMVLAILQIFLLQQTGILYAAAAQKTAPAPSLAAVKSAVPASKPSASVTTNSSATVTQSLAASNALTPVAPARAAARSLLDLSKVKWDYSGAVLSERRVGGRPFREILSGYVVGRPGEGKLGMYIDARYANKKPTGVSLLDPNGPDLTFDLSGAVFETNNRTLKSIKNKANIKVQEIAGTTPANARKTETVYTGTSNATVKARTQVWNMKNGDWHLVSAFSWTTNVPTMNSSADFRKMYEILQAIDANNPGPPIYA